MIKSFSREMPDRIKGYVRENWGAPFIGGFMALLTATAALMVTSSKSLANNFAIYTYFILVVGVILQIVCYLKYNKRNCEKNNGSS